MDGHPYDLDPEVYAYLRALSNRIHRGRARGMDTIRPTELLHEAWIKASVSSTEYNSREHFMAVAATAMRQILVDRARSRMAVRNGGGWEKITLSGLSNDQSPLDVVLLDDALQKLEKLDPRAAKIVTLRTFGGLTQEEIAKVLDISERSVRRTWRFAKAHLRVSLR